MITTISAAFDIVYNSIRESVQDYGPLLPKYPFYEIEEHTLPIISLSFESKFLNQLALSEHKFEWEFFVDIVTELETQEYELQDIVLNLFSCNELGYCNTEVFDISSSIPEESKINYHKIIELKFGGEEQ